jgi:diguanylate cyclase (GGDEF)-like protein
MHAQFANAVTDSLTGLFTRGEIKRYFAPLSKGGRAGFFLLDIDHFKLINDCNGHTRGDEVLVSLSRFLRQMVNDGYLFRMGGDEFLIMVPGYGKRASQQFARRLCRAIGAKVFKGKPELCLTLSMGIALLPDDGTTIEELLTRADDRLYHAKRSGRNQFCIKESEDQEHPILHEPQRLIGREKLFLRMKEQLDTVFNGEMKIMIVSGEGGVGITFLCNKFLEYAGMRGACIRRIRLDATSAGSSLFREIIESVFESRRALKSCLRDTAVEYRDELVRLLRAGGVRRPPEEYRMVRGLIGVLGVFSRRGAPLVLFVDHFERGGAPAMRLLDELARFPVEGPVFLLVAFEGDTASRCEEVCSRYKTCEPVSSAVLKPFSRKEQRTLIKTLLRSPKLSNTLSAFVFERAEGNPLLTREVLFSAIEKGIILREENQWVIRKRNGKGGLSASIQKLLRERLRSLSTGEKKILRPASVLGKTFGIQQLAQLQQLDEEEVVGLLRGPISLGVIKDEGKGRFSFRLMYRDVFYEQIPVTERALLHRKIGEHLARCGPEEQRRRSYHHFRHAGEDTLALRVGTVLFKSAMAEGKFKEAKQYLDFILEERSTKRTERLRLLPLAAQCYVMNGMYEKGIALYREVAASLPEKRNRALLAIARLHRKQGKPTKALDVLLSIETRSTSLLCDRLHAIAEALMHMGRLEKAEEYARKLVLLSTRHGKRKQEADGYYTIAGIFWYKGEYELAEDFVSKALQVYREIGREKEAAHAMNRAGIVKWSEGNLENAAQLIEHAVVVFKQRAGVEEEHRAYTNLGILYEEMGQWKTAHMYYRKSLDMALFLNVVPLASRNHNNIGTLLLKEGNYGEALLHLRKALSLRGKGGERLERATSYHNLGVAYLYQGMYGKAAHFLIRARTVFEDEGALGMLVSNLNAFFELYSYRKQFRKAEDTIQRILELIDINGTELQRAQFYRVLARFRRVQGKLDEARKHARRSVELLDPAGEPYERGKALYELGLVLFEDKNRDEAKRMLRKARAAFKQLGAKKALERVEQSMVQRGVGAFERRRRGEKR